MLREENKRPVRVRVCGDLARYVTEEDLVEVSANSEPSVAMLEPGQDPFREPCLIEPEQQAA